MRDRGEKTRNVNCVAKKPDAEKSWKGISAVRADIKSVWRIFLVKSWGRGMRRPILLYREGAVSIWPLIHNAWFR